MCDPQKVAGKACSAKRRSAGTLKGTAITFSVKVKAQDQDMTITYSGTVEGDTMKGKVAFGDAGEGSFTGKRSAN